MSVMVLLVLVSISMGAVGLAVFLWSFNARQYDDMDGAAERVLIDDDEE